MPLCAGPSGAIFCHWLEHSGHLNWRHGDCLQVQTERHLAAEARTNTLDVLCMFLNNILTFFSINVNNVNIGSFQVLVFSIFYILFPMRLATSIWDDISYLKWMDVKHFSPETIPSFASS